MKALKRTIAALMSLVIVGGSGTRYPRRIHGFKAYYGKCG